jgi:hypothetical protein
MPEAGAIHSINGGQWLDLETGNDSFRFKASSAAATRRKKKTTHVLTPA